MPAYTLVVMSGPVEGREDEYNDWYSNQHLGDVLNVKGFTAARRFLAAKGHAASPPYMALYDIETDDPEALLAELTKHAGTPAMPISTAMDAANTSLTLYAAITPLVTAKA
jgi:hypothetical protein